MQKQLLKLCALVSTLLLTGAAPSTGALTNDPFAEVLPKIREHAAWIFTHDPDWERKLQRSYGEQTLTLQRPPELIQTLALDHALREVSGGFARFLTPADQEYLALASKFSGSLSAERYLQSGAWFARRGKRWFVEHVFAETPAAHAGLIRGDEIISVNGRPLEPVGSFMSGGKLQLSYRRLPWEEPRQLALTPIRTSTQEILLAGMQRSQRIVERQQRKIGIVWLTAASHASFRTALHKAAQDFQRDADAMILDLRGDFGGGDLTYSEAWLGARAIFKKKLIVLVDQGTRGGREALAHLMQTSRRAVIVGAATAGDITPGVAVPCTTPVGALYLPTKLTAPGFQVQPDVAVDAPLVYAAGADPAMIAALEAATKQ